MKKITSLILSGSMLFLISCQKNAEKQAAKDFTVTAIPKSGDGADSKILRFTSWEAYDNTLENLQNAVEDHETGFLDQYPDNITDEELDDIEDAVGHDENAPLREFEVTHGFTSLLGGFLDAEEDWLNNDELDEENVPEDGFHGLSEEELTLVNEHGALIVGTTIYVFRNEALHEFPNLDYNAYNAFVGGTSDPDVVEIAKTMGSCKAWKSKKAFSYYGNRRIQRRIRFHNYPHKGVTKARIKSYRKRRGRWRLSRAKIGAASDNYYVNKDCSWPVAAFWDSWRVRNRRKRLNNFGAHYAPIIMRVNKNDVLGNYRLYNNYSSLSLTW